jgi:hypothetical protein
LDGSGPTGVRDAKDGNVKRPGEWSDNIKDFNAVAYYNINNSVTKISIYHEHTWQFGPTGLEAKLVDPGHCCYIQKKE